MDNKKNPMMVPNKQRYDNVMYGVNVSNREEVEKAYKAMRRQHTRMTLLAILVLVILAIPVSDFVRVKFFDKAPFIAIKKKIENGYSYQGLGYVFTKCDDGTTYLEGVQTKSCTDNTLTKYSDIIKNNLKSYLINNKYIDKVNLVDIEFNELELDEEIDNQQIVYYADTTIKCTDGSNCIINRFKEQDDDTTYKLYLTLSRANEVVNVETFRTSGKKYDEIVEDYKTQLREYLVNTAIADDANLKHFQVELLNNYARRKYDGMIYQDCYLIRVSYTCGDAGNTCIDFTQFKYEGMNLAFDAVMFVNGENKVVKVIKPDLLEI